MPMTPAPPFQCSQCGRTIAKQRTHVYVPATESVWCLDCFSPAVGGSRPVHARVYPDCEHRWHDMYDHPSMPGSRAGIASFLGLWPARGGS